MTQIFLPLLAQSAPPAQGGASTFIMMALMFVMMYFVLIRPQRQKQKEHEKLINSLKVGDHVILNGGEHGLITSVKERTVMIKVADNVKIEYDRAAIATVSKKSDVVEATTAD